MPLSRFFPLPNDAETGVNIAILGTGSVATALGVRWAQAGHRVTFGSRQPECEKVLELLERCGGVAAATTSAQALVAAEVIVLAVPWQAAQATLASLGDLGGRVLIDATNPLKPDLSGIELRRNRVGQRSRHQLGHVGISV